jgi:predicted amidohydrolase
MRAEEVPKGVPLVVLEELSDAVCVTLDVVVRVCAEEAVKEEEEVLVDVGLGSRVTEEVPVEFAVDEADPVTVGQEVVEGLSLRVRVSEGEPRALRDPVTELVLVLDVVEDAECVVVGVSD